MGKRADTRLNRMLRNGFGLLLLVLCAVGTTSAAATEAAPPPSPPSYDKGLLWKVETKGRRAPNYVFGTIHVSDPRVTNLPKPVREALDGAENLSLEIDFTMWSDYDARQLRLPGKKRLSEILGDDLFARVRKHVHKHLAESSEFERVKPWVAMMALTYSPADRKGSDGRPILDLLLRDLALARGIPVFGLETNEEHANVFDKMPMAAQVKLIRRTLAGLGTTEAQLERVIRIYLDRDLARILAHSETIKGEDDDEAMNAMYKRLLDVRNRLMVRRMHHLMREGGAFVAVGAAHLPGEKGVLHLLARRGYRIERVY